MNATQDKTPTTESKASDRTASYREAGVPTLTLELLAGARYQWDMSLAGRRTFRPARSGNGEKDELTINFLDDCIAKITGYNLETIFNGFKQGQGCVISEQGERFASLHRMPAEPGRAKAVTPFVSTIVVEEAD